MSKEDNYLWLQGISGSFASKVSLDGINLWCGVRRLSNCEIGVICNPFRLHLNWICFSEAISTKGHRIPEPHVSCRAELVRRMPRSCTWRGAADAWQTNNNTHFHFSFAAKAIGCSRCFGFGNTVMFLLFCGQWAVSGSKGKIYWWFRIILPITGLEKWQVVHMRCSQTVFQNQLFGSDMTNLTGTPFTDVTLLSSIIDSLWLLTLVNKPNIAWLS